MHRATNHAGVIGPENLRKQPFRGIMRALTVTYAEFQSLVNALRLLEYRLPGQGDRSNHLR